MSSSSLEAQNFGIGAVPQIRKVGRPRKYQTVEELEDAIQAYFDSCFIPKTQKIRTRVENPDCECDLGAGDCKCRPIYELIDTPVKDKDDQPVFIQIQPFTITGLALAIDMTREGLLDYEKKPSHAEFADTIKKAKQIVLKFNENRLHSSNQVTGVIFNLKNNFNWIDRQENFNANVEVDDDKVKKKVNDMFGDD